MKCLFADLGGQENRHIPALQLGGLVQGGHLGTPVSYTHLDVYKRQGQDHDRQHDDGRQQRIGQPRVLLQAQGLAPHGGGQLSLIHI